MTRTESRRRNWISPRRVALGLTAHAAPSIIFVIAGIVLGPQLLNVVSVDLLAQLDPVISLALAILGVFIGSGLVAAGSGENRRWVIGAAIQALTAVASVAVAMYLLLNQWALPLPVGPVAAAFILGIGSAASAAVRIDRKDLPHLIGATHLADFDDIAVVLLAAIAVPILAGASSPAITIALGLVSGLIIAGAGFLLFSRAHSPSERGVFVIGTVVLLAGAAAYISGSPLFTGCVAGFFWARRRTPSSSLVESELQKLQHPLVAVLLIIAGASIQFSRALLWVTAPLVLLRMNGKLLGGLILARWLNLPSGLLATILIPPGVLGIAVVLNAQQVMGTGDTLLVSAITIATVVSEIFAPGIWMDEDDN
jgi:hypothetical protein